jgi:NNP family nitrate/nitrite transporter-like MFS transporter
MAIPIQRKEIGPVYAGTAGGRMATVQLLGAVVFPTYVFTPLAGASYERYFLLVGVFMLVFCLLMVFVPMGRKSLKGA